MWLLLHLWLIFFYLWLVLHLWVIQLQLLHPARSLSLSAVVLLHVVFGLPRFRRPSGVKVTGDPASIIWFLPYDVANEFPSSPSHVLAISAICRISLLVILSCHPNLSTVNARISAQLASNKRPALN